MASTYEGKEVLEKMSQRAQEDGRGELAEILKRRIEKLTDSGLDRAL